MQGSRRLASWRKGSQGEHTGICGAGVLRLRGGVSTSVGFQWNKDGSETSICCAEAWLGVMMIEYGLWSTPEPKKVTSSVKADAREVLYLQT